MEGHEHGQELLPPDRPVVQPLILALLLALAPGCAHHGLGGKPSGVSETLGDFPILKSFINNAVERDSPNL